MPLGQQVLWFPLRVAGGKELWMRPMIKQFLKFTLVGISNGAVNFLVYNAVLLGLQALEFSPKADYLVALAAGFVLSVLWAYVMSRKFVFNSEEEKAIAWYKVLAKMYIVYSITGIGLNSALSILWVQVFDIPKEVLTIINDIVCFPVTFLLNKFWSFKKTRT